MSHGCERHRSLRPGLALLALTLLASGCTPFRPVLPPAPAASGQSAIAQQGVGAVIAQQARELRLLARLEDQDAMSIEPVCHGLCCEVSPSNIGMER